MKNFILTLCLAVGLVSCTKDAYVNFQPDTKSQTAYVTPSGAHPGTLCGYSQTYTFNTNGTGYAFHSGIVQGLTWEIESTVYGHFLLVELSNGADWKFRWANATDANGNVIEEYGWKSVRAVVDHNTGYQYYWCGPVSNSTYMRTIKAKRTTRK